MTSSARTFEEQCKLFKLAYPDETFLKVERTVAEVFWNSRDEEFAELKAQLTETLAAKVEGFNFLGCTDLAEHVAICQSRLNNILL